ncbi:MAG: metal-dependent transcriptional regulator [Deltaproteobacteria bacterium]|nr:MAG: metal-dependent transcriptional regulator [Deltaproteobacteria bacterium]
MRVSAKAEEILEALWIATEEEGMPAADLAVLGVEADDQGLVELLGLSYVDLEGGLVSLRQEGRDEARMTVRRHRLAERLMMDILDIQGAPGDDRACEFEHLLHHGVDTKICTLLNHPTTCPHGKPIPPGECCDRARLDGRVGVVALTELKPGDPGEIAYLAAGDVRKMQKLMSMGVLPGTSVLLLRTYPTYIFKVGQSEFAVDEELAGEIFVRRGQE